MQRLILSLLSALFLLSGHSQTPSAELVSQNSDVFLRNGKLCKNISDELMILNRNGEKYSKVSIPYSRMIKISKLEAYVKDSNGVIVRKLQKSDVTTRSAISDMSLYEDDFVKEFTLRNNTYPYTICYSYQLEEEEYYQIDYWIPVLDRRVPTLKATLNVEVPRDYKLFYKNLRTDTFKVDTTELTLKYSWTASYKDIIEPETFSPSIFNLLPRVVVVPSQFHYDQPGSYESWSAFGDWHYYMQKDLSDLPPMENSRILDLINGVQDTKTKIKKLFNYLQDNTRYVNITMETGGLKPYPAKYVAENKYGDCKALANYFKSVLKVAGIASYYTLVYAGDPKMQIDLNFPSQQFNHAILCIPVQDTLWLDCTSKDPFNYSGTFTQNRSVFIVDKNRSYFTVTPALSSRDVNATRIARFHQTLPDITLADFINTYRGDEYELLHYLTQSANDFEKSRYVKNEIAEDGFELLNYNLTVPPRDSSNISISYTAKSSKVYKNYGKDLLIDILPFSLPRLEDPKKRKLSVQIDYPILKSDSLEYEIPAGYKLISELPQKNMKNDFGRYKIECAVTGNKVKVFKSFLLNSGQYELSQYGDLFKFVDEVINIEKNNKIVVNEKY